MLAKDIKIKRLKRQRDFIEMQLQNIVYQDVEESAATCLGVVYKENIEYFQKQGINVQQVVLQFEGGLECEAYAFTPKDVELTDEELQMALNYDYASDVENQRFLEETEPYEEDYYDEDEDLEQTTSQVHKYLS